MKTSKEGRDWKVKWILGSVFYSTRKKLTVEHDKDKDWVELKPETGGFPYSILETIMLIKIASAKLQVLVACT